LEIPILLVFLICAAARLFSSNCNQFCNFSFLINLFHRVKLKITFDLAAMLYDDDGGGDNDTDEGCDIRLNLSMTETNLYTYTKFIHLLLYTWC
jgi:hypothetical protein